MSVILNILQYPDKDLRIHCEEVTEITEEIHTLIDQMRSTIENYRAVGLAAPQVSIPKRVVVIRYDNKEYVLINPVIESHSDETNTVEEMCLSFVGADPVKVTRYNNIVVRALDEDGNIITHNVSGMLASIFQHEVEHLDGVLLLDHLSNLKKSMMKKRMLKVHKKRKKYR